jgi:predicted TIM-barrel fold metal-dependent hydrolase
MPELTFLDCNVTVGRRSAPRPENDLSPGEILAELEYAGISAALAIHAHAREYDPRIGNERMSEVSARHPEFLPCYVLLPHHTREFPAGDALLHYLEEGGARAVRLFPKEHSYCLGETWCGALFSTLAEAGVPVLLDVDQTDWPELDQVMAAHPRMNLLLLRVGYRIDRWIYPLLERYPGLRLEPSLYPLHGGIEAAVERFGAERIVFGTGMPVWDAGAPVAQLRYARIGPENRRKIAVDNLRSLLWKASLPPAERPAKGGDAIWSRVRNGEILDDLFVVDAHAHLGVWFNFRIPGNPWAEGMVAAMDACGIDVAVIAPHAGIGPDMAEGNALAADAVGRFPKRFAAYCAINPNCPESDIVAEMDKYLEHPAFKGIKIHPVTHDYPADGDRYRPVWEAAAERGLPVLVHTWDGDARCRPSLFDKIGEEFPNARIILGHSGATPTGIREAAEAVQKRPNLHLDLTKSLMHRGMVEVMVAQVGAERILFGTDLPFIGSSGQIGHLAAARISEEDKQKIFGLNARKLFDL